MEGFGRSARKTPWQPEADGGGTLVDKFAYETGWAWSPERRQDGAGRLLGIVGGCVGNTLPQSRSWNSWQQNQLGTVVWRNCLEQPLDHAGFLGRPSWAELRDGERLPRPISSERGEWHHGWQYHASSSLEYHFRETAIVAQSDAAEQAHLRSHAGPGSSEVLCGALVASEFKVEPQLFRALVLERLRLPLDVTDALCECGGRLDLCIGQLVHAQDVFDHGHRALNAASHACAERQGQL